MLYLGLKRCRISSELKQFFIVEAKLLCTEWAEGCLMKDLCKAFTVRIDLDDLKVKYQTTDHDALV